MWRANPRALVTRQLFLEWRNLILGPAVKKYLQENNPSLQALLVLDNGHAHLPNLEGTCSKGSSLQKVSTHSHPYPTAYESAGDF